MSQGSHGSLSSHAELNAAQHRATTEQVWAKWLAHLSCRAHKTKKKVILCKWEFLEFHELCEQW